jgi:alkylation response protein AidB-like acyl-CoA dehydrogenase
VTDSTHSSLRARFTDSPDPTLLSGRAGLPFRQETASVNESSQRWVSQAEEIAEKVLAVHMEDVDRQGRWPKESVAALAKTGLLGLTVPAECAGAGEGPRTFARVTERLARRCASTAMIYLMHTCGIQVVNAAGAYAGRAQVLREAAAGRHLSTLAFSEKGSRSHFWAPVSQAVADDGVDRLSAQKSWVTSAGHADGYVVSTRAAERREPMALTLYYLPRDAPGLTVSGAWNGLGLRGNASAPMRLEDVRASTSTRLSAPGEGFPMMLETAMPWFQLGSAAVSVGLARAATEATRQHLLTSKLEHVGESLASLMNLRARLARMQTAVDTQQAFLEHVARRMEDPGPDTLLAVLQSKAAAAEAALEVTDLAMRACGGAAFSRHLSIERNFRDARAGWVMAPTTDVLYDFIGRTLLDLPLF